MKILALLLAVTGVILGIVSILTGNIIPYIPIGMICLGVGFIFNEMAGVQI
ncbi:MAG: hypothetical protein WC648_02850 [Candidatus Paceibacterota bacterium]|jgi:hypothetical protein